MVTPLAFRLVSQMIRNNGSFMAMLLRIQCGFLPQQNIQDAKRYVEDCCETLKEVEKQFK